MEPVDEPKFNDLDNERHHLAKAEPNLGTSSHPKKVKTELADPDNQASPVIFEVGQDHQDALQLRSTLAGEISRRQHLEQELLETQARFKALANTSPVAVGISTSDGRFLFTNAAYAQTFGYTLDEINRIKSGDLYCDPNDRLTWLAILLEKGMLKDYEVRLKRKDGTPFWALISVAPIQFDNNQSYIGSVVDITEQKHVVERLTYQASFPELNPNPIVEVKLDKQLHYANTAAKLLYPDLVDQTKDHPWFRDWEEVIASFQEGNHEPVSRDVTVGDHCYQQSLVYVPEEGVVRIYGIDITQRVLAELALRQAHDELEQKVQERTQELNIANSQLRAEVSEREKVQTDLETSMQELQVIEEELRNNNEMLMDAQKVLDSERQRFQDLFDFAPDGYLVTNMDGKILEANQAATMLLAISHQNLIGKPLIVFIDQSDHKKFEHLLVTLKRKKGIVSQEYKYNSRSGIIGTAATTIAATVDPMGKNILRWTIRDITERKQTEETIRQNSLRSAVISEVSQSLAEASLDEQAVLDIVVKTTARLVGDSCVITMASEDGQWLDPVAWSHKKPSALQLMSKFFASTHHSVHEGISGRVYQSSQPMLVSSPSGIAELDSLPAIYRQYLREVGVTSLIIVPMQIANTTIGTMGLTRDSGGQSYTLEDQTLVEILANRTAQSVHNARLYQELQNSLHHELETHDQLVQAEKFAAVGRLLASITHEINNPLQTIKNCLYLIQVDSQPETPAYNAITMAMTETNRLSNLVAQLREVYRPPAQWQTKPVNLPSLIDEVRVLLVSYLKDKHVNWVVTPPDPDLSANLNIVGVPDQLKQVFLNIGLNAIDAMDPEGGDLTISFMPSADRNQVGIRFRDTGPGLPEEVKAKLFEPFVTTKEKGLGLGLVICYDIIQKHNGRIEVESKTGNGASFTIWLPNRGEEG